MGWQCVGEALPPLACPPEPQDGLGIPRIPGILRFCLLERRETAFGAPKNLTKKWYTQRKRQGIKPSPKENASPPEETFPVSPVAPLPRIPQIYSNGTRWYLDIIYVANHVEKLYTMIYIISKYRFWGIYDRTVKCNYCYSWLRRFFV